MLKMFEQCSTFDYLLFDQKIPNMVDFLEPDQPDHRTCVRVGLVGMNPDPNISPKNIRILRAQLLKLKTNQNHKLGVMASFEIMACQK
jgi:hypothetical protein